MESERSPLPELNLAALMADPAFRADLLFFIRLAGTYCQTIFWAAFPRSAKKRRQKMLETVKEKIGGAEFLNAVLDADKRHSQTTDIFHKGFVGLLQNLAELPPPQTGLSIKDNFSRGLRERHGLPWNMADFIYAANVLTDCRSFLEHYEERLKKQKNILAAEKYAKLIYILGLLLLPQFGNESEHSAKRVKNAAGAKIGLAAAEIMHEILGKAKAERKDSIKFMFAEARARKNMYASEKTKSGKFKNKTQKSYEFLNAKWRKYYYGLKLSPTDLRENNFKLCYDFIGEQNLKQIYALLGSPLAEDKLKNFDRDNLAVNPYKVSESIYDSEQERPSFRYEILPLYIIIVRIQKLLHFYLNYAPVQAAGKLKGKIQDGQLKEMRNIIAHNGLFWRINNLNSQKERKEFLPVKEVFRRVMEMLTEHNPPIDSTLFYNSVKTLLAAENCPIDHRPAKGEQPSAAVKIRPFKEKAKGSLDKRAALRLVLTKWEKNLQKADIILKKDLKNKRKSAS